MRNFESVLGQLDAPARNRTTEMHETITRQIANKAVGLGSSLGSAHLASSVKLQKESEMVRSVI